MTFDDSQDSYKSLQQLISERTRPLIVWAGSGLSLDAELPSWLKLRNTLIDAGRKKADAMDVDARNRLARKMSAIEVQDNLWVAFQRLKEDLGTATYEASIRKAFAAASTCNVPAIYRMLWHLPIRGLLTLNIDRLATRAYSVVHKDAITQEMTGFQLGVSHGSLTHRPYLGNLHGVLEQTRSWVFTHSELNSLYRDEKYRIFLQGVLTNNTNIFVGVSADDVAIGGHLHRLRDLGIELPTNYWITNRSDDTADQWAESVGIRVIRYKLDETAGHSELRAAIQSLVNFVPPEDAIESPILNPDLATADTKDLSSWRTLSTQDLRRRLNTLAVEILRPQTSDCLDEYKEFFYRNDQAIHAAWYTSVVNDSNMFFNYRLERQVAQGGFGRVFEAVDIKSGEVVAVKILLEEVRRNETMLNSFRRGVRTMRILASHTVPGLVAYREAGEIPAFVAMEWIDGPNLEEAKAVPDGPLQEWSGILDIAASTARIIQSAHHLPERVLHRDIRPANIMLRNYWHDNRIDVVVLDFDLSWHKDAIEPSALVQSANGYLAPEQMVKKRHASSRNAAVDSFGLGMTLFFMMSGRPPFPAEHLHASWQATVSGAARSLPAAGWKSTPRRFCRLVISATSDIQSQRPDFSQIVYELNQLREAEFDGSSASVDLNAEEILARCAQLSDYAYDPDIGAYSCSLPTGLSVQLRPTAADLSIELRISWTSTGVERRGGLGRALRDKSKSELSRLRRNGWEIRQEKVEAHSMSLTCAHNWSRQSNIEKLAESLREAVSELSSIGW